MSKSIVSVVQLILFAMLTQICIVPAIVVERNYHAYYKLPIMSTHRVKHPHGVQQFYILQCPHKANTDIPRVKDMQICIIIGKYRRQFSGTKPKSTTYTRVNYKARPRYNVNGMSPSDVILVRPAKLPRQESYVNSGFAEQSTAASIESFQPNGPTKQVKTSYNRPGNKRLRFLILSELERQKLQNDRQVSLEELNNTASTCAQITEAAELCRVELLEDADVEHDYDTEAEESAESNADTKEQSVQEVIRELSRGFQKGLFANNPEGLLQSSKFFDEQLNQRKGDKWKAYENHYHRDEIYNDHIFYDDELQRGHLREKQTRRKHF